MTTLLYMHPSSLEHDTGPGHPESPRAHARDHGRPGARGAQGRAGRRRAARAAAATREQLERVHTARYVDAVLRAEPASGHVRLDPDTVMSPGSGEAALRAAGAAVAAVDAVIGGEAANAFCALRPPGHHAEAERAMGFCLFNSVAIGARQALDVHGVGKRVDLRLRRAPRQRHPAQLRARAARAVSLDPPVAALPGHRGARRDRGRQHRQPAAARRHRLKGVATGGRGRHSAGDRRASRPR